MADVTFNRSETRELRTIVDPLDPGPRPGQRAPMATVVGFISEKGGVGKTTACYHIGVALQRYHGKKVLVVDADYQRGGITCRFIPDLLDDFRSGKLQGKTLYEQFQRLYGGQVPDFQVDILDTPEHVGLIPADPRLAQVTVQKVPSSNNILENNKKLFSHLSLLRGCLEPLTDSYDYILIDSHPELSDLMRSVVYACDYCVSPVKLDAQSTIGVPSAQEAINEVNRDMQILGPTLGLPAYTPTKFAGAIAMMTTERSSDLIQSQKIQYRRLAMAGGIFDKWVTEGDGVRNAAATKWGVYDVTSANADRQAQQFRDITKEFMIKCP
jgi:chromosome partitioning protein